ncbi:uncharacterized protein [Pyrus communis]|uniref:uncharacterized protein isoform X1 n=1 Tax=Pyrus communis TaxID=23211 RepID=UPI0035BEE24E
MGFNAVFGCLKEVFPQVDFRILRAIAIEHPFDADAAVLDVLSEFPNLATQSFLAVSPVQVQSPGTPPLRAAQQKGKGKLLMHQQVIKESGVPEPGPAAGDDHTSGVSHGNPTLVKQVDSLQNGPVPSDADTSTRSEAVISDVKGMNFDVQVGLQQSASGMTSPSMPEKDSANGTLVDVLPKWKSFYFPVNCDSNSVLHETHDKVESFAVDSSFREHAPNAPQCDIPPEFSSGPLFADDNLQATGPSDHTSEKDCSPREMVDNDNEETATNSVCNIDVLEEIIEDAKHNKDPMTSGAYHDNPTLVKQVDSLQNGPVPSDADTSTGSEAVISDVKGMNFDVQVGLQQSASGMTSLSMPEKDAVNGTLGDVLPKWKSFYFPVNCDSNLVLHETRDKVESFAVDSSFPEHVPNAPQCDIPPEFRSGPLLADDNLQATGPSDHTSEKDCTSREMVDNDIEETATNSVCNIDVLEEIIEDAKHNKKTLFSAMESVISMMREVEVQEKAVDIVQEEASRGGLDIMVKVEDLKQMLAHAKDANDMHAGEVFGEKAILATEARELQSRLLNLSDDRDKSLAILNEMCGTLEERLDAAAEARRLAEQDKLEKEECAWKALAEQEAEVEKVVQESKILQQQAEENSKLREFLMDRGRIVDMLQGEISVICQDVRFLKEKFDERVPLSESVSSSQTSCILASSGSSMKSVAFDLVPERLELPKSPEKASPAPSVNGLSPKSILEQERTKADQKELIDDGWDVVFDKELDV